MTEQQAIEQFRNDFDNIGFVITAFMVKELENQGHKSTGKLMESVERETKKLLDGIDTAISYLDYGGIVNSGVTANRIPFSGVRGKNGSGATSKFITALMEWVRFKGFAGALDKDIKRATFAIARNMKKEGISTKGSYAFSNNGRRMKWVDFTIAANESYIETEVGEVSDAYVQNLFWSKIEGITSQHKDSLFFQL